MLPAKKEGRTIYIILCVKARKESCANAWTSEEAYYIFPVQRRGSPKRREIMPDSTMKIGDRIRRLRNTKEMSIKVVSERSGIPELTISSIESDMITPSLGNIVSLAKVLNVSVGDFFGDGGDVSYCIVRSGDRTAISRFSSDGSKPCGYSYESLGQKKRNKQMEPFLVTLSPVDTSQIEPNQHVGEEFLFVLQGKDDVYLLDKKEVLDPGDSIYYDSSLPHIVSCHGQEPATLLAVIYARDEMIIL